MQAEETENHNEDESEDLYGDSEAAEEDAKTIVESRNANVVETDGDDKPSIHLSMMIMIARLLWGRGSSPYVGATNRYEQLTGTDQMLSLGCYLRPIKTIRQLSRKSEKTQSISALLNPLNSLGSSGVSPLVCHRRQDSPIQGRPGKSSGIDTGRRTIRAGRT